MRTSDTTSNLHASLSAFAAQIENVPFSRQVEIPTSRGGTIKFQYAELSAILAHVRAPLASHGLSVVQDSYTEARPVEDYLDKDGVVTPIHYTAIDGCCVTRVCHASGEWLETSTQRVPSSGSDARSVGGALSYARRYSLVAALGLAGEDDNDGEVATPAAALPPKAKAKPATTPRGPATPAPAPTARPVETGPVPLSDQLWHLGIGADAIEACGLKPREIAADKAALLAALPILRGYSPSEIGSNPGAALAEALATVARKATPQ